MGLVSVERDIQHELLNARSSRRKPGHIPYPLKYSTAMASFDVWDHMFFSSCCQSLTMHQFDTPPETILDLGCGTGYWAIEAAKQWPRSTIVGVDIAKIQPPLASLRDYKPIASRVQWINANFLDGLPFLQSNHFDFVRIVGIGLAVPEDEWQHLLEEVFRVMKPGAVIEIIEEDLLFPCATPPHRKSAFPPISFPSTLELTVPSSSSITLCSTSSADERSLRSPSSSFPAGSPLLSPTTSGYYDSPTHEDEDDDEEPSLQNHGRLKKAWDSMLSSRFICSKLLSVLPFYIASSSFGNVKSHPACKIPLPHNSGASSQVKAQQMRMMHEDFLQRSSCASPRSSRGEGQSILDLSSRCQESSYAWSRMHLAKTVNTIKACKEAIWQEYARLFPKGRSASVRHINGPRPVLLSNTSCREAFESDWRSWENDMEDRIGMRDCLIAQLSWSEPSGERPDWRVWRSHLEKQYSSRDSGYASLGDGDDPEDLCRSVAGFVGWKPN